MEECQSLNRSFINEREDLKNRVRLILQKIETYSSESFVKDKLTEIKGYLKSLEKLDKNILSNIYKYDSLRDLYVSDRDTSFQYKIDTEDKIALIADNLAKSLTPSVSSEQPVSPTVNPSENSSVNTPDRARPNLSLYRSAKEPPIQIGRFEGDEDDKLAFSRFLSKFKALIDNNSVYSDEEKLIHLISNLGHTAYDMVKHLSPEGHNYAVALDILKLEYLDKEFIVEKIFQQLYEIRTPQENNLATLKGYINEMKVLIYDLKSYGFDFLIPETPGFKMISSMIIYKLPPKFKNALIEKVQNNYPSILEVFEHSPTLLKRMELGQRPQPQLKHDNNFKNNRFGKPHNNSNNKNNNNGYKYNKFAHNNSGSQNKGSNDKFARNSETKASLENFKTTQKSSKSNYVHSKTNASNRVFPCKFCSAAGHGMNKCPAYPDLESRLQRCDQLNICRFCSSAKHATEDCPGHQDNFLDYACAYCNLHTHISALCEKGHSKKNDGQTMSYLCINYSNGEQNYLLPFVEITLHHRGKQCKVLALIDSGSQRSYVSTKAAKQLLDLKALHSVSYDVHSFVASKEKSFFLSSFDIDLPGRKQFPFSLLIDESFDIKFEIPGLEVAYENLNKLGYRINAMHDYNECIELNALIGIDLLQYLPPFKFEKCMNGACFNIGQNIVPFGDINNFLYSDQITKLNSFTNGTRASCENVARSSFVNQVLSPSVSYFNPLMSIFDDSEVEHGLDNLFTLESLGIKNIDEDMAKADILQVSEFNDNIVFKDKHYFVKLPWKENVDKVPSNFIVARKVLDRVVSDLHSKNLFEDYNRVFEQHLADDIIEKVDINPSEYVNFIFIPHRPVIKMEAQVTTKIRPVFNCSLKTHKNLPSLNEAAYPGIDLMSSLLQLLLKFRCNKYVVLADIKQAFLAIKLLTEEDKNRFCFFWIENDKIVTYRYTSLVFGFVSSPFILHYVMRFHASKFPNDLCSKLLTENFYVDNFFYSSNDCEELEYVYKEACVRMNEASFFLRSWNSNLPELNFKIAADGRLAEHGCSEEKVLGYRYNLEMDTMSVSKVDCDIGANTKRSILSAISSVFDPIGLVLPITVSGKILMRYIWSLSPKVDWDTVLNAEVINEWKRVAVSLNDAYKIPFKRMVLSKDNEYGVHIFCDSSKTAYGFVMYACYNGLSDLIFAKTKLAPLKELSIPCLELMAVVLAFKCLPNILSSFEDIKFKFLNFVVDAQVVLTWLLTNNPKSKSKMVKNRLKDIELAKNELISEFKVPIFFRYTDTNSNPADLLTKGITFKKFNELKHFWEHGPPFLSNNFADWPVHDLLSIPPECKAKLSVNCSSVNSIDDKDVYEIEKFSDLNKLIRLTAYLFKFRFIKVVDADPTKYALLYWIRRMQIACFKKEIEFLKANNKSDPVPPLVNHLDLFLDKENILRSHGRISKSLHFNYEICNPILLAKIHPFTRLIILNAHSQVQHLGVQTTLNHIRNKGFWIPQARQAVKTVLSTCFLCKKYNALCYNYPKLTNLPRHQLTLIKPFYHVGVDFTSHIWIKDTESGNEQKMYILLFTCLSIRALHMELVPDMTTENFLLAFQRFCNRYTIPSHLYSDNARAFVKAGDILSDVLSSQEFCDHLTQLHIKHVKIPLYAAFIGAAWERLIRTVKSCLYKTVQTKTLSYFELLTTLSSIQNAINSRPLTYRDSENDLNVISPNSFLKMHSNSSLVFRDLEEDPWREIDRKDVLESLDQQLIAFEEFRRLWYEQYLLSLREYSRNLYQSSWTNRIKCGDVVLIKLPNKPRPFWLLGKVIEVVVGYDNIIRSVKVKQSNGKVAHHSICNLFPMELSITHPGVSQNEERAAIDDSSPEEVAPASAVTRQPDSHNQSSEKRPVRKAAVKFRKFLKENLDDL